MKFVKSVTKSSRGRLEGRVLIERGEYAVVKYFDIARGSYVDNKFKIYLKTGDKIIGYLLIKLKDEGRYLAIEDRNVDKEIYAYNLERNMEEPLFK